MREGWRLSKGYQFDVRVQMRTQVWQKYLFGRAFTSSGSCSLEKAPEFRGFFCILTYLKNQRRGENRTVCTGFQVRLLLSMRTAYVKEAGPVLRNIVIPGLFLPFPWRIFWPLCRNARPVRCRAALGRRPACSPQSTGQRKRSWPGRHRAARWAW